MDTSLFIYFVERHPTYVDEVRLLFRSAESGELELITSALTVLEVLVVPFRAGNAALAARYEALLSRGRGLRLVEVDRTQLRSAAHLRATYPLRTPDALQLAAALSNRCSAFVTNDRRLPSPPGLPVVQLADHL